MALLVDLFGYLGILLHGLTIAAQSVAIGGVLYLCLLAWPLASRLDFGMDLAVMAVRWARVAALALALFEALGLGLEVAVLVQTVEITPWDALGAHFAQASLVKIAAALGLAAVLGERPRPVTLLVLAALELAAATLTTHAAARLHDQALLLAAGFLHQFGAAIWVGGIPFFVAYLSRLRDCDALALVGARFSRLSMAGVASILISGATMCVVYIGSWEAVYGTAYCVMVGAKAAMFGMLLVLGAANFSATERLRRPNGALSYRPNGALSHRPNGALSYRLNGALSYRRADGGAPAYRYNGAPSDRRNGAPETRLRRFAEVEIGIGLSIFFAAASLTSVPPAVDLTRDRVTWQEVVERNTPVWPRLVSPEHDELGIPALQARLDAESAAASHAAPQAFVPGSGELPPRNAFDIAWSEYNHHWAGLFVLAIALLALAARAGVRWARHWPLLFIGLALFLLVRSDPEVWPLGQEGFFAAFRDIEVLQHRIFVVVIVVFGLFEWAVRTGRLTRPWAPLVFPLATALGGALLLTHSHQIANVKDQLLIELTHTPLALAGISAGWARWIELRLPGRVGRACGFVWPVCFLFVAALLLLYREA